MVLKATFNIISVIIVAVSFFKYMEVKMWDWNGPKFRLQLEKGWLS
jgi:hypothetical protein